MTRPEPLPQFAFTQPGWEDSGFFRDGTRVYLEWRTRDSRTGEPGRQLRTYAQCPPDASDAGLTIAAWHCVRSAVTHEAGEFFLVGGHRQYDPHNHSWWRDEYHAPPHGIAPPAS